MKKATAELIYNGYLKAISTEHSTKVILLEKFQIDQRTVGSTKHPDRYKEVTVCWVLTVFLCAR